MDEDKQSALKAQLFQAVEALGIQNALFPSEAAAIDPLVVQLEQLNPTPHPRVCLANAKKTTLSLKA